MDPFYVHHGMACGVIQDVHVADGVEPTSAWLQLGFFARNVAACYVSTLSWLALGYPGFASMRRMCEVSAASTFHHIPLTSITNGSSAAGRRSDVCEPTFIPEDLKNLTAALL